jgi:hypothetical protein
VIAAALVAALFVFGLPSQAGAAECHADICRDVETTPDGLYVLIVPILRTDCVWNVEVDFGDGTGAEYLFEGEKGLIGSHLFPEPGVYIVKIDSGAGTSATDQECIELTIEATVTYPEPVEPPDEPPKEEPPPAGGGTTPAPATVAADSQVPDAGSPPGTKPTSERVAFWRHCRASVLTHLVACGKGRRVARAASEKLKQPGSARVSGFSCRLPRGGVQPIACARGEQRVLVPAG